MPHPVRPPLTREPLAKRLSRPVQRAIAGRVVAMFNDPAKGETPVARRRDGLFGPDSVAWRVHGDVTGMLVGGVSGLLLQMLHPAVLAGVWDHSNFRADMHGRLRRTARFIAVTTYGGPDEAQAAIDRVRRIHEQVVGVLPDGTPYQAADPGLLAWVHVTEATSFLAGWRRYAEPGMSRADQDRYFAEMAVVGEALGADPLPRTLAEARGLIEAMRAELRVDDRTREVARLILEQPSSSPAAAAARRLTLQAGIDLLPAWARWMHGLDNPIVARPLIRAGTFGMAGAVRWAFETPYRA